MTEKVKVTREQAEAIERGIKIYGKDRVMNDHEPDGVWVGNLSDLNGLTKAEIAKALYIGYEVEPEFKVGDWVVSPSGRTKKIEEIKSKEVTPKNIYTSFGTYYPENLRHATRSEIEEEKERRWWRKHGRESWELRYNDTLICDKLPRIVDKIADLKEKTVIFTDGDWEYFDNVKEEYKILVFAKNRLDVKTND